MKNMDDYLPAIMDCLEYADMMSTLREENMEKSFSKETNTYQFRSVHRYLETVTRKEISIKIDKKASSIMIKNDVCVESDIKNIERIKVKRDQTIMKFKVLGGKLNIFTFSFIQELTGKEVSNPMEKFDSISDFLDIEKRKKVGENNITFEQEQFTVSENYHITDGLDFIDGIRQKKLTRK